MACDVTFEVTCDVMCDVTGIPELPDITEISELHDIPVISDIPELPDLPDIPELPDKPDILGIPDIPDIPECHGGTATIGGQDSQTVDCGSSLTRSITQICQVLTRDSVTVSVDAVVYYRFYLAVTTLLLPTISTLTFSYFAFLLH